MSAVVFYEPRLVNTADIASCTRRVGRDYFVTLQDGTPGYVGPMWAGELAKAGLVGADGEPYPTEVAA